MEPPKAPRPRPKPRSKRKDLTLCPRCLHIVPEVDRLQAENAELRELVAELIAAEKDWRARIDGGQRWSFATAKAEAMLGRARTMKVSVLQAGKEWFVCLVQGVQSFEVGPRYEDTPHESGKLSAEWSASMLRKAIEAHNAELLEADDLKGPGR